MGEANTCGDCCKWEEKMYWTHFQIKHFCLFLVGDFIDEFALPKTFANHLKGKLPDTVTLKGPSGFTWNVGLVTVDDNLFFKNGWKEFIIDHSLEENYILVFKYNGDSHFDVLMFDSLSFCEKETSYFVRKCGHTKFDRPATDKTRNSSVELNNDSLDDGVEGPSTKKIRKDDDLMAMPLPLPSGRRNFPRASRKIQKKTRSIKPVSPTLKLINEEPSTCAEEEEVTPSAPHLVLDENEDCVCLSEVDFGVERIDERMSISKVNPLPRKTTAKKWIALPTIQRRQVVYRPVKNKDWLYHHMFYDISCEEAATIEAWMGNDFSGPFGNEFLFKSDDIWLDNSHALHFVYEREDGHCTNLRWISTDAINSYLQLLRKRQATHGSQMRKSFFFPTYYSVIAERDGLDTDRTDPTFNGISNDLDLIFLPVIGKDHFMLVVADLGDKTVTIYDSMPNPAHKKDVVIVVHWMIEFVCRQILGLNDVKWTPCQAMKIPVQDDNGDDCGIYVLTFIVCLATVGEIREFKKNDIKNMRRRMLLELMAQKLLPA